MLCNITLLPSSCKSGKYVHTFFCVLCIAIAATKNLERIQIQNLIAFFQLFVEHEYFRWHKYNDIYSILFFPCNHSNMQECNVVITFFVIVPTIHQFYMGKIGHPVLRCEKKRIQTVWHRSEMILCTSYDIDIRFNKNTYIYINNDYDFVMNSHFFSHFQFRFWHQEMKTSEVEYIFDFTEDCHL